MLEYLKKFKREVIIDKKAELAHINQEFTLEGRKT